MDVINLVLLRDAVTRKTSFMFSKPKIVKVTDIRSYVNPVVPRLTARNSKPPFVISLTSFGFKTVSSATSLLASSSDPGATGNFSAVALVIQ